MLLLDREEEFEYKLRQEHIEDILMDKRISWATPEDLSLVGYAYTLGLVNEKDNYLRPKLSRYQEDMRKLYDYRLLRDWGYGRLWKKLYMVFDTAQNPNDAEWIQAFNWFSKNHSKLAYDLFSVHPVELKDIDAGDLCTVCYCQFESGETVME